MSASFARARLARFAGAVVIAGVVMAALAWDAQARAAREHAAIERTARIARLVGLPGLALSASSTWLRHPTLAPPSAGASEAPLGLDVDPAGGVIARPQARDRAIAMHREAP